MVVSLEEVDHSMSEYHLDSIVLLDIALAVELSSKRRFNDDSSLTIYLDALVDVIAEHSPAI